MCKLSELNQNKMQKKERHGCLTAWLIYLIIAYSISTFIHFFNTDAENKISENMHLTHGALGILGIVFSVMIFNWVKLGFYGVLIISIVLSLLQAMYGQGILSASFIFLCLLILFLLLQIKKANTSGWNNLE